MEKEDEHLMTNEQLDGLAKEIPFFKSWLSAVETEIQKLLESGEEMQHAELVPTRSSRSWLKDIDVLQILKKFLPVNEAAPRSPLSVSQAEKKLGKAKFNDKLSQYVESRSSGTKVTYR